MKASKDTLVKYSIVISTLLLVVLSIAVLIYGWIGGHFESVESFQAYIESFGILGPVVLCLIQCFTAMLPILPSFMGCIAGGIMFGAVGGFLANYIGICMGSIFAYLLARKFGVKLVDKMISLKKYEKYTEKIERSKSYTLFLLSAIALPLAPDNFLCYFSGLIKMPPKKFIIIILLAKPWCILFYSITAAYFS